jgi:hypothetical protein
MLGKKEVTECNEISKTGEIKMDEQGGNRD